jgi:two-component SAPR family response regulator
LSEKIRLDVISFSNPIKALENFHMNIDLYSIVLTDFKMYNLNGVDFALETSKLRGNSISIIMIEGYSIYDFISQKKVASLIDRFIHKTFPLMN